MTADTTLEAQTVPAIRATGLVKDFSFRRVLDEVSLVVPAGSCLSLFGPNGAGKTTLLRILATLSRPTQGVVEIEGRNARGRDMASVRARLGLISHQSLLYDGLTGLENLLFFGNLYAVPETRARAESLLRRFDLWTRRDDRVWTYSRGMQQRLSLARALVHDPQILLLDEPFTGLDPAGARLLDDVLEFHRAGGRTVLLTTHDVVRGLAHSDRWAVLVHGRIAGEGLTTVTDAASFGRLYEDLTVSPGKPRA